jgi:hypothetical protein
MTPTRRKACRRMRYLVPNRVTINLTLNNQQRETI